MKTYIGMKAIKAEPMEKDGKIREVKYFNASFNKLF